MKLKLICIVLMFLIICIYLIAVIINNKDIYPHHYKNKCQECFSHKIIHQTWKHHNLNDKQKKLVNTWKKQYPDWEYKYWTDDMLDDYVKKEFGPVYQMWSRLTPFIKKIDCIRYMWLYTYGGIYSDFDLKSLKSFEKLLKYPDAAYIPVDNFKINWKKNKDKASPALIASSSKHPFWLLCVRYICQYHHLPVKNATGPIALANVVLLCYNYKKTLPFDLIFLKENKFGLGWLKKIFRKYTYHINTNDWDDNTTEQKPNYNQEAINWLNNKIKKECGDDFYHYFINNI